MSSAHHDGETGRLNRWYRYETYDTLRIGSLGWLRRIRRIPPNPVLALAIVALMFGLQLLTHRLIHALTIPRGSELLDVLSTTVIPGVLVALIIVPLVVRLSRRARNAEKAISSTRDGYWVINADARFVDVNQGYCQMLGYSREALMAMTIADLEEVATLPQIQAQIRRIIAKGYEQFETRHRHSDGRWVELEITVTSVDNRYLVAFLRDVSVRKAADLALREATRIAESANRAKSEFLANMSHEIRTPMNGVMGMAEIALDLAVEPRQREYLNTVLASAQSLMVILNEILDFSKIEAGQVTLERTAFDLRALLESQMAAIEGQVLGKGLSLEGRFPAELPPLLLGDPGRIRQVVSNLCDNAIKFTHNGGLVLGLQIEGNASRGYLAEISVADTGIGIALEKQTLIFDAFSQADTSTTRKFGGTGLGLTICRRLVNLMGGRLWLESSPSQGSTFRFTVQLASVTPDSPMLSRTAAQQTTRVQRSLRILLVEDHPVNQLVAATLLRKRNHQVVVAENGQQAVELFPTADWDIVLMDMQMPVMDGIDATVRIRASETAGQRVPIIAITANALASDRDIAMAAGMDGHLPKPFNGAQLDQVLEQHCG